MTVPGYKKHLLLIVAQLWQCSANLRRYAYICSAVTPLPNSGVKKR